MGPFLIKNNFIRTLKNIYVLGQENYMHFDDMTANGILNRKFLFFLNTDRFLIKTGYIVKFQEHQTSTQLLVNLTICVTFF